MAGRKGAPDSTVTADSPFAPITSVRGLRLEVRRGPDARATFTARGDRTVVGTHESCDFVLTDPTVSRFHFEILSREGRVELRDLGSLNGTLIAGVSVLHAILPPHAVITAGNTEILI